MHHCGHSSEGSCRVLTAKNMHHCGHSSEGSCRVLTAKHMHHCGHSSEGSCRVLTDISLPSGAIICQAHASLWS